MIKIELTEEELQLIVAILDQIPVKGAEARDKLSELVRKLEAKLPKEEE